METNLLESLAPAMLRAGWAPQLGLGTLMFTVEERSSVFRKDWDDVDNAEAAALMLDEMESRGWRVRLERYHLDEGGFPFYISWRRSEDEPSWGDKPTEAGHYTFEATRAIAVAKAFIAVMGWSEVIGE